MQFVGQPYHFGGNYPGGWDCSGYVCELLGSVGAVPFGTRTTAQGLYNMFEKTGSSAWTAGSLAFFGADTTKVEHVGFCLDQYLMLEAGGGDETVVNLAIAAEKHAFVRMRPIRYRKDFLIVIKPSYARIGLS